MIEEVGRFEVVTGDGAVFTVVELQEFIDARTYDEPHAPPFPGLKMLQLTDGSPVNHVDEQTVFVFAIGKNATRVKKP